MDQPPRSAFIAGVVRPDERTATMGITTIVRTMAAMVGPTVTGFLAGNDKFWIAFVVAGSCRLMYDVGLYVLFINVKLYQHEGGDTTMQPPSAPRRFSDEEEMTEMEILGRKDSSSTEGSKGKTSEVSPRSSEEVRLAPHPDASIRRRSLSPMLQHSER